MKLERKIYIYKILNIRIKIIYKINYIKISKYKKGENNIKLFFPFLSNIKLFFY